jgi:hypothetical protein
MIVLIDRNSPKGLKENKFWVWTQRGFDELRLYDRARS